MPAIKALPYDYTFDTKHVALILIDMQRDFVEPGGFGAALGNNVGLLTPIIPTLSRLLKGFRELGLTIIHTKECHKPDLSDCPQAKPSRGRGKLKIGDVGPMGRILINGEPGNDFVAALKPLPGELAFPEFKKATLDMVRAQGGIVGWTATAEQVLSGLMEKA